MLVLVLVLVTLVLVLVTLVLVTMPLPAPSVEHAQQHGLLWQAPKRKEGRKVIDCACHCTHQNLLMPFWQLQSKHLQQRLFLGFRFQFLFQFQFQRS